MTSRQQTVWRMAAPDQLRWRSWDNQFVVYDARSGDTHLLDRLAGESLKHLGESPATAAEVVRRLTANLDHLDSEDGSQLVAKIEGLLIELEKLGLIESVPS